MLTNSIYADKSPHLHSAAATRTRPFDEAQRLGADGPLDGHPRVADRRWETDSVIRIFLQHSPEEVLRYRVPGDKKAQKKCNSSDYE